MPYSAKMPSLAIGEHGESERHGELTHVGLQLRVRGGHVGLLDAGLLQLDDHDGQPVAVEHEVEPALVVPVERR